MDATQEEIVTQPPSAHRTIGFVGMNDVLLPFVAHLHATGARVIIWNGHQYDSLPQEVLQIKKQYGFFGLSRIIHHFLPDVSLPYYFAGLSRDIRQAEPDVVIVMDHIRFWFWQTLRAKKRQPHISLYLYSETKRAPSNPLARLLFPLFMHRLQAESTLLEKIFTYTEEGKKYLSSFVPVSPIEVMPVPIDERRFFPELRKRAKKSVHIAFLMNARFTPFKHHADLLQAVALLPTSVRNSISVTCIGKDDGLRGEVEKCASSLGLSDLITFQDPVPKEQMRSIYADHDVLVLPSYNEAIGMVVPEAMACGLATITSDTVGANEYVEPNETGFVFATGNVAALADCLRRMATDDTAIRMGNAAAQRMREKFRSEALMRRFARAIDC